VDLFQFLWSEGFFFRQFFGIGLFQLFS